MTQRTAGRDDDLANETQSTRASRTQQERTAESSKRLLEAAGELIVEHGFANVTLAMVGERAGYSRGLASMRFGTKEKLLEALVERITTLWHHRNVVPQTAGRPALDGVLILVDEIRGQIERDPRSVRVLYNLMFEALASNGFLRQHFIDWNRDKRENVAVLLRRGIEDGSVRPDTDVENEAANIVASLRGTAYQWVMDPDGFDPVGTLALLSDTIAKRLKTE